MQIARSPFNYVGGKHKLVNKLRQIFPPEIKVFADVFCGGLDVCRNVPAEKYLANDKAAKLIELYRKLREFPPEDVLTAIDGLVSIYGINPSNKNAYLNLRSDYNAEPHPFYLMALVANSFNHQFRFNKTGQYNMPFGGKKCLYNPNMRNNLGNLVQWMRTTDVDFSDLDFRDFMRKIDADCFVYCDPPYCLSQAVYNDGWTAEEDAALTNILDDIDRRGIKFALSNVLFHNDKINEHYNNWSQKYKIVDLDWRYYNCSYHKKNREHGREVIILNY